MIKSFKQKQIINQDFSIIKGFSKYITLILITLLRYLWINTIMDQTVRNRRQIQFDIAYC